MYKLGIFYFYIVSHGEEKKSHCGLPLPCHSFVPSGPTLAPFFFIVYFLALLNKSFIFQNANPVDNNSGSPLLFHFAPPTHARTHGEHAHTCKR